MVPIVLGLCWGYMRIMEKTREATILGFGVVWFRVLDSGFRVLGYCRPLCLESFLQKSRTGSLIFGSTHDSDKLVLGFVLCFWIDGASIGVLPGSFLVL